MRTLACATITFLAATLLLSCSSGESPKTPIDTTPFGPDSSAAPAALKPFEPDDNYTAPTEVVSQYGPSGIIRDVVIAQNGMIWMAAWDGVVSYNPETKQFTNHTLKAGLSHHRVCSVMEDSKGNLWFGTMGAGAYRYDGARFTNLSTNNGMVDNVVFDLFEDYRGNIWFATAQGVSKYDGRSFINVDSTVSLPGQVYAISEDKYLVMWFGGENGLFRYNDTVVEEVQTTYNTSYMNTRDLYCDEQGTMWVGTARGLYRYDWEKTYLAPGQVNSNFTSYINTANGGHLLLSANGIIRFDPAASAENPSARHTTLVEGGRDKDIFGAREANDGTIWYGAMDGLHSVKDGKDSSYKKP